MSQSQATAGGGATAVPKDKFLSMLRARKTIAGTKCTVKTFADQKDGEVDWNYIGEMGTRRVEDEVASVEEVDFKFGRGKKGQPHSPSQWRYVHEKYEIMVFKKNIKGSALTIFMGRGVIDAPLRTVAEFLKNVDNNLTWDNLLVEAKYVKVLSESNTHADYIGYQRFESTKCFVQTNRDMLYYVRYLYKDNHYVQAGVSVEDPEYVIPDGLQRVEIFMGSGWLVEPYQGSTSRTLVTYIGDTDLKGIPPLIMNLVLKRHPLALRYIRRQLTEKPRIGSPITTTEDSDSELDLTIRSSSYQSSMEASTEEQRWEEGLPVRHFMNRKSSAK